MMGPSLLFLLFHLAVASARSYNWETGQYEEDSYDPNDPYGLYAKRDKAAEEAIITGLVIGGILLVLSIAACIACCCCCCKTRTRTGAILPTSSAQPLSAGGQGTGYPQQPGAYQPGGYQPGGGGYQLGGYQPEGYQPGGYELQQPVVYEQQHPGGYQVPGGFQTPQEVGYQHQVAGYNSHPGQEQIAPPAFSGYPSQEPGCTQETPGNPSQPPPSYPGPPEPNDV